MNITPALLISAGIAPTQARQFAEPMRAACALFDISTPVRLAAFLAQCIHESAGFTRLEENLWYTTPDRIDALVTVAGGAAMLGWLLYAAPAIAKIT